MLTSNSLGLAAGYGIHESASQNSHKTSPQAVWPCDSQQAANCRSSWCPAGPLSSTISRQGQRSSASPETSTQQAYYCPALSCETLASNKRRRTQQPPPVATMSADSLFTDPGISTQIPQMASKQSSNSPPAGTSNSVSSVDPNDLLNDLLKESPISTEEVAADVKPSKTSPEATQTQSKNSRPTRLPHSIIERRYRDNLNRQLETLRSKLPNFKDSYACSAEIEDSGLPAKWPSKAVIIAAAIKYIEQMESERDRARAHATALQQQVDGLQKLVRCDDCSILNYLQSLQINPNAA